MRTKVLVPSLISDSIIKAEYAVRGRVLVLANQIEAKINDAKAKNEKHEYPFDNIIYCNIGNPQRLQQKPITFLRQLLACIEYPELLNSSIMPEDVQERARALIKMTGCRGATGAYSHSKGILGIRKDIATFIENRDGYPVDPEQIFITDGASVGVKTILNCLIQNNKCGIMIPIPQYPLYSASITLFGGVMVDYYLGEDRNWGLDIDGLEKSYQEAVSQGVDVRGIVVINPGNPTGELFTRENIDEILEFACRHHLVLMADEVYQENIYGDKPFFSFRKALLEHKKPEIRKVELISFHSVSKGFFGECGKRGGYMQLDNIEPETMTLLYKLSSINLCSNIVGQIAVDVMVKPPKPGDPSYELYIKEKNDILASLKRRAEKVRNAFLKLKGYECVKANGSMYLFPRIEFSEKFIKAAAELKENPDDLYCIEMLKATGICVVPGSGFGQVKGTFHYRTSFLPEESEIETFCERIETFHNDFMKKYE